MTPGIKEYIDRNLNDLMVNKSEFNYAYICGICNALYVAGVITNTECDFYRQSILEIQRLKSISSNNKPEEPS